MRSSVPSLEAIIPLSSWSDFLRSGTADITLPDVRADGVAQIQYTSGTTGVPKGARLTHRSLANNGRIYARTIGAGPNDIWVNPMPMFHTAGCGLATLGALQTGGTQVLPSGFDPELMLRLFEEERGTIMLSVPTMLIRMLEHPSRGDRDLSSWRLVTLGGAPVAPELVRRAESFGIKVAIGFGQTEASPYLTHTLPDDPNPDWVTTVGRPMAQTEIKIIDPETKKTVPLGVIGEICARGYSVMKDYFDSPDATREALDIDGWLHTGDLGSLDDRGYCRVQGRRKDMIIRGGENIYPREIEDVLHDHASVSAVSVVGIPDADLGEILVSFVQLKTGAKIGEQELMDFCRSRLAYFKVPRMRKDHLHHRRESRNRTGDSVESRCRRRKRGYSSKTNEPHPNCRGPSRPSRARSTQPAARRFRFNSMFDGTMISVSRLRKLSRPSVESTFSSTTQALSICQRRPIFR
jgi:fatty-acyl-CoA synthase